MGTLYFISSQSRAEYKYACYPHGFFPHYYADTGVNYIPPCPGTMKNMASSYWNRYTINHASATIVVRNTDWSSQRFVISSASATQFILTSSHTDFQSYNFSPDFANPGFY